MSLIGRRMYARSTLRIGLALLVLCGFDALVMAESVAAEKMRLSIGIDPAMAMYLVAKEAGIFSRYGIEAEVIQAESGGAALEMTIAGQTAAATTTELPGIRARSRGAKIFIPAVLVVSGQINGVVASPQITKPEDLVGRKVGITKGTSAEYYYTLFVAKQGLPGDKIQVVYVSPQEMIPALLRGDINAYFSWEPWLRKGVETVKGARILARGEAQGYYTVLFAYVTEEFARNKDLSARFMRALIETEKYIRDNRREVDAIVAKAFRLEPGMATDLMNLLEFNVNLESRWIEALKSIGRWMFTNKLIEREPDYEVFIVPDILRSVAPERVTYRPGSKR